MLASTSVNNAKDIDSKSLLWSQPVIDSARPILYVCIIAAIVHALFWLQLIFYPSLRQKTMQWIYAYLITDIFLLFRFFFTFIVHTKSPNYIPSRSWATFVCYFEAIFDNYLNVLEVYIILALNLCRYAQIARNKNVYATHMRLLTFAHLAIYFIPLIIFIIQLSVGWAQMDQYSGGSCDVGFTSIYVQIFNVIITFALPIILNIMVIYASIRHVHSTAQLHGTEQRTSASEKYHRSLVLQFLVFYIIWLSLWSPNIIIYQFTSGTNIATSIGKLLNFIEITLDPFIIAALDVRFCNIWKRIGKHLKNQYFKRFQCEQRRIGPTTVATTLQTIQQKRTTRF